jgi:pyridoxamine 5'-phosphate oxidase
MAAFKSSTSSTPWIEATNFLPRCVSLYSNKVAPKKDPIALFQRWLQEAIDSGLQEPFAMAVATVSPDGSPDARMMLLKGVDERGFVLFTNLESAKAKALMSNPRTALCFHWMPPTRQVRVRGRAALIRDEEADEYFATRPRLSQISAWASKQSRPMRGYFELEAAVAKAALRFGVGKVPRPPFWSGYRVVPEEIEFWTQKPFRRHERILYTRASDGWQMQWLYP